MLIEYEIYMTMLKIYDHFKILHIPVSCTTRGSRSVHVPQAVNLSHKPHTARRIYESLGLLPGRVTMRKGERAPKVDTESRAIGGGPLRLISPKCPSI